MSDATDLKQAVEGHYGISVIRGGGICRGWNGIQYRAGLSAKNVNARKLSMNVATIPPGGVAYAHIHDGYEVMLYIVKGRVKHIFGPDLKYTIENEGGDFIFIDLFLQQPVFVLLLAQRLLLDGQLPLQAGEIAVAQLRDTVEVIGPLGLLDLPFDVFNGFPCLPQPAHRRLFRFPLSFECVHGALLL